MADTSNWDFFNKNVQSGLLEGRYLNAAFTMIAAGPPRLAAIGEPSTVDPTSANIAFPIGVIQNFNVGQSSQVLRLFENAYLSGDIADGSPFEALYTGAEGQQAKLNSNQAGKAKGNRYARNPGNENIWLDLASDVFSQPIGLMLLMRDSNNDTVGAFYFEYCMITNHGFAADSGGTILSENASIMFERVVPINAVDVVGLVANGLDLQSDDIIGGQAIGSAS